MRQLWILDFDPKNRDPSDINTFLIVIFTVYFINNFFTSIFYPISFLMQVKSFQLTVIPMRKYIRDEHENYNVDYEHEHDKADNTNE